MSDNLTKYNGAYATNEFNEEEVSNEQISDEQIFKRHIFNYIDHKHNLLLTKYLLITNAVFICFMAGLSFIFIMKISATRSTVLYEYNVYNDKIDQYIKNLQTDFDLGTNHEAANLNLTITRLDQDYYDQLIKIFISEYVNAKEKQVENFDFLKQEFIQKHSSKEIFEQHSKDVRNYDAFFDAPSSNKVINFLDFVKIGEGQYDVIVETLDYDEDGAEKYIKKKITVSCAINQDLEKEILDLYDGTDLSKPIDFQITQYDELILKLQ